MTKTIKRRITRPKELGTALWQARDQQQFSQKALAEKTGLYRQFVSEIENGQASVSIRNLLNLISELGYYIELHPRPEPTFDLKEHVASFRDPQHQKPLPPNVENAPIETP